MIIKITASLLISMSYSVFNVNWKHLALMSLVRQMSCDCSTKWTFHLALILPLWPFQCDWLHLYSLLAVKLMTKIVPQYHKICFSLFSRGIFLTMLLLFFFFFYRILSHNKIRVLRNGSFFGLYALDKLWAAYCLLSFWILHFCRCYNVMFVYMRYIVCIHVWAVILACLSCFCREIQTGCEIWAALCASIHSWASVQQGEWYTQTGYHRVMSKSSYNYTSLSGKPHSTAQDKGDFWEDVHVGGFGYG